MTQKIWHKVVSNSIEFKPFHMRMRALWRFVVKGETLQYSIWVKSEVDSEIKTTLDFLEGP